MSQKYSIRVVNMHIIMIKLLFTIHTRYCKYKFHYIIFSLRLQQGYTFANMSKMKLSRRMLKCVNSHLMDRWGMRFDNAALSAPAPIYRKC